MHALFGGLGTALVDLLVYFGSMHLGNTMVVLKRTYKWQRYSTPCALAQTSTRSGLVATSSFSKVHCVSAYWL